MLRYLILIAWSALPAFAGFVFGYTVGTPVRLELNTSSGGHYTVATIDRGWYNQTGYHDPFNPIFLAGDCCGGPTMDHNSFFVFRLPAFDAPIVSATLNLFNPPGGTVGTNFYSLYDVSTPIELLLTGGVGQVSRYSDLETGVNYGGRGMDFAETDTTISIELNAAAIAAVNAGNGGFFAIGGSAENVEPVPEPSSVWIFCSGVGLVLASRRWR